MAQNIAIILFLITSRLRCYFLSVVENLLVFIEILLRSFFTHTVHFLFRKTTTLPHFFLKIDLKFPAVITPSNNSLQIYIIYYCLLYVFVVFLSFRCCVICQHIYFKCALIHFFNPSILLFFGSNIAQNL